MHAPLAVAAAHLLPAAASFIPGGILAGTISAAGVITAAWIASSTTRRATSYDQFKKDLTELVATEASAAIDRLDQNERLKRELRKIIRDELRKAIRDLAGP